MKLFFILGVSFFMFSFLLNQDPFGHQSPRYIKLAHEVTEKTAKKLEGQSGLDLVGTGGQMMDDIQMMAMDFNFYQEVDLKTSRKLIVHVINEYLEAINRNKEIRPHLHEYPFTAKNVEIRILIYNPDGSKLPLEKIYCIECMNGILEYYTRSNPHQAISKESYEEALQAISSSSNIEN